MHFFLRDGGALGERLGLGRRGLLRGLLLSKLFELVLLAVNPPLAIRDQGTGWRRPLPADGDVLYVRRWGPQLELCNQL